MHEIYSNLKGFISYLFQGTFKDITSNGDGWNYNYYSDTPNGDGFGGDERNIASVGNGFGIGINHYAALGDGRTTECFLFLEESNEYF